MERGAGTAAAEGLVQELIDIVQANPAAAVEEDEVTGLTPLHLAARFGHRECVTALVTRGAPVSKRSLQRLTPLHLAAQGGHDDVVEALLSLGAQVNEADHDSWTPLHHAAYHNHVSTIQLLLARGADIAARNQLYCTPLHVACQAAARDAIAELIVVGAQFEFQAPLLKPVSMMPLPPSPTTLDEGATMEHSQVGAAMLQLLGDAGAQLTDCVLICNDGQQIPAHRCVLAVRSPSLLQAASEGQQLPVPSASLRVLLTYLYSGSVADTLMQGLPAQPDVLRAEMEELITLVRVSRTLQLSEIARIVQRSVVLRIGRGGPPRDDGFNPDMELLARVAPFQADFDSDFRLLLGFFVHSNFSALMQYFSDRMQVLGDFGMDRATYVRALVGIFPVEQKVKVARPSRWHHWRVPPLSDEMKLTMMGIVNQIKNDKLAGWFLYPVSAIDYNDPQNTKSTIVDYWAVCPYPMHLEGVTARLEANYYVSPEETLNDLRLTFCNAMRYNDEGSELWEHALALYYLTGQYFSKQNIDLSQFPRPFEQGTLDDWVDVNAPHLRARWERAFQVGRAPTATEVSVDPFSASGVGGASGKKKGGKQKTTTTKRGRKDLKESDWKPPLDAEGTPQPRRKTGGGGGSTKSGGSGGGGGATRKAVKTERGGDPYMGNHMAQPPPPLPVPELASFDYPPPPPPELPIEAWPHTGISFDEKQRLGEDIQRLGQDQINGLFELIQSRGRDALSGGGADEEVELDLNRMSDETIKEVRRYVDRCLGL